MYKSISHAKPINIIYSLNLVGYFSNVQQGNGQANSGSNRYAQQVLDREVYNENPDYRRAIHRQSIFQHYQTEGMTNEDGTPRLYRRRGE